MDNWRHAGWGDSAPGMAFVTSITRTQQILSSEVDLCLKPFGLSFARFELLRLLAFSKAGMLPMGVIGNRLQVHPASVTSAVDRLERDGLVKRQRSTEDRRRVLVAITADGRERVEAATIELNEVFRSIPLDEKLIGTVNEVLRGFRQVAGDFEPPEGEGDG